MSTQMKMTIIRGISQDDDQKVPEINPDVMHLGLARQRSLLSNLPDFTSLLESLNTPTLKAEGFDFTADLQLEAEQALNEQFNFGNIDTSASLYPESQNPMIAQLKSIQMIEVPPTNTQSMYPNSASQQLQYPQPPSPDSSLSPASSPSSGYSSDVNSSINMGIDNETESNRLDVIQNTFQITKTEVVREDNDQKAMEELTKKMDRCCTQLNLPRDPTLWSSRQVQQWAVWISRECYNFDYSPLHQLQVDGTTLCMLKQDDFIMKIGNDQLGQLLFIELEIWRNALCIETETRNQAAIAEIQRQQQQHQLMQQHQVMMQHQQPLQQQQYTNGRDDPRVYTDLSNATPSSYTITDIPTPVISPASSHMTTHDMTLTLNEINQTLSHEMYNTSQNCGAYQQISPSSNLGSTGASWEESSDSSSNFSQDYVMADDENSRASTPSHPISGTNSRSVKRGPIAGTTTHKKYGAAVGHTKHTIHLWQFLRELLMSPNLYNNCIRWIDQRKGIFKIEDSTRVARLWGQRKNRPAMNYDKLSRSIRQYYKKGIIKKTEQSKRLVYQFCEAYL